MPMGVADPLWPRRRAAGRRGARPPRPAARATSSSARSAGVTPEKRLPQVLDAVAATGRRPSRTARAAGRRPACALRRHGRRAAAWHRRTGCTRRVRARRRAAGLLQAADICACLRWPTNGETSASWLRAMAAGRATIITDLAHQPEVPVVDPRGWRGRRASRWPSRCRFSTSIERCAPRSSAGAKPVATGPAGPAPAPGGSAPTLGADGRRLRGGDAAAVRPTGAAAGPPRPPRDPGGRRLAALLAPYGVEPPAGVAGT